MGRKQYNKKTKNIKDGVTGIGSQRNSRQGEKSGKNPVPRLTPQSDQENEASLCHILQGYFHGVAGAFAVNLAFVGGHQGLHHLAHFL